MVELSFHQAIRSGDADAHLIYADWLEDHGRSEESALLRSGRWCLVPAGSFWMGGGGGKAGDQQVEVPHSFYLGTYPVTQAEWQEVMGNNPSSFSRDGQGKDRVKDIPDEDLKLFPVESVSWNDTQEFIKKLNEKERGIGFWYRLPTEAEWEYACRAAASSQAECSYHFYPDPDQPTNSLSSTQANFDGNYPEGGAATGPYVKRPSRVGSYKPNKLGLFDMHGNVWEWCNDAVGSERVFRGGGWRSYGSLCQAGFRDCNSLSFRYGNLGLRLARVPSGS